jgi:hypothetical protein
MRTNSAVPGRRAERGDRRSARRGFLAPTEHRDQDRESEAEDPGGDSHGHQPEDLPPADQAFGAEAFEFEERFELFLGGEQLQRFVPELARKPGFRARSPCGRQAGEFGGGRRGRSPGSSRTGNGRGSRAGACPVAGRGRGCVRGAPRPGPPPGRPGGGRGCEPGHGIRRSAARGRRGSSRWHRPPAGTR